MESESGSEPDSGPESKSGLEAGPESGLEAEPEAEPESESESGPEAEPEPRLASGPEAAPEADRWYLRNVLYFGVLHLLPFGALITGAGAREFIAAAALYWIRIWFVTAGYHCYFSHRAFATSRAFQLLLAIGAQASGQGSVLRWATAHRYHHANSDHAGDLHSPHGRGLWYAHMGWLLRTRYLALSEPRPGPLTRFPELVWLDRHPHVPPLALAAISLLGFGAPGLCIVYGLSTVLVYHATFTVNSLAHRFGTRPYETPDQSRNNWFVALIMLGGGWHNNHHRFPRSARQGLRWWEIDVTYYVLVVLARLGIVRALRAPRIRAALALRTRGRSHRSC